MIWNAKRLWLASLALTLAMVFALAGANGPVAFAQGDPTATPVEGEGTEGETPTAPEGEMTATPAEGTEGETPTAPEGEVTATPMEGTEGETPMAPEGELTATPVEGMESPTTTDFVSTTIGEITGNSEAYFGQTVAIEGVVNDFLNIRIIVLGQPALLGDAEVLVVNNSGQEFPPSLFQGQRAWIVGVVYPALNQSGRDPAAVAEPVEGTQPTPVEGVDATPVEGEPVEEIPSELPELGEEQPGPGLPPFFPGGVAWNMFDGYHDHTIVEVTSIEGIGFSTTIADLVGDPGRYAGRQFYVEGEVGDPIANDAFLLAEGALVGNDQIVVFNRTGQPLPALEAGQQIRVYGEARPFDLVTVESETGQDFDDTVFTDYQDYTMFLAERVNVLQFGQ